ncbi:MAG: Glycosyl transferase group 1, partial [Candidatus Gottesmanbacteria bacterium GW2011_GWC2_39_8]
MLIGIDGYEANVSQKVGIGQYAFETIRHLLDQDKKNKYRIYIPEKPIDSLREISDNSEIRIVGPAKAWTQWRLPIDLYAHYPRPNVFFTPTHYAPRFSPIPQVISIMDLSYLFFPEMFRKSDLWQLKLWTDYSIKKAKAVLTISESTKNDIVKLYRIPAEKITVTYPGYNADKFKIQNSKFKIKEIKDKYKINGEYLLYVGTLQPRKNLIRLIDAFILSMQELNDETTILVLAGKKGWLYKEIFEKVIQTGMEKRIVFTDFVCDEDLPWIISGAKCLTLVSLYEGFGIPVVEAMACGVPVVVSSVSSLPE